MDNFIESNNLHPVTQATIGGGASNAITYVLGGTIAGGIANKITGNIASTGTIDYSTIGGGIGNGIFSPSEYVANATISGGSSNFIREADGATIGGGSSNIVGSDGRDATIAGGLGNTIEFGGIGACIGGGAYNFISAGAYNATISGGASNFVYQSSPGRQSFAMIPGGRNNSATNYAYAAGCRAKAVHQGAFVWADNNEFDFPSTNANSFSVRAVGGTRFVSAIDGAGLPTAGVVLEPGSGSWTTVSDRNAKENIAPVSGSDVLEKLDSILIATWNYKAQDKSVRHIGPMAQDFAAAFHVGESDRGISTVDADGVALAAIQGLHQMLKEKDARIESLEKNVAELKTLVRALAERSGEPAQ